MQKEKSEARKTRTNWHPRYRVFRRVHLHFASLFESVKPPLRQSDGTLTFDTPELRMKCLDVVRMVDRLVGTPIKKSNGKSLHKQVISLWVEVQHMRSICQDLERPLERLSSAIGSGRLQPKRQKQAGRLTSRSSGRTPASRRLLKSGKRLAAGRAAERAR